MSCSRSCILSAAHTHADTSDTCPYSYHNTHVVCHITTHTWCVISQHTREVSNHKSHHQPRVMDVFLQDPCTLYSLSPSLCGFQKLGSTMIESEQMHRELHAMLAGFKRTYSGACRICVFGITPSTDLSLRTIATRKCVCVCVWLNVYA